MSSHTKTFTRIALSLAVAALAVFAGALVGRATADDHDEDEVLLPPAVGAAVARAFPSAEIVGAVEEEHCVPVFEVEVVDGEEEFWAVVSPDGHVVSVAREMDPSELPEAVRQALDDASDGAEIDEVIREEAHAKFVVTPLATPDVIYLAEVVEDDRILLIAVDANGQILHEEHEEFEDEEDWDEDDEDEDDEDEDDD